MNERQAGGCIGRGEVTELGTHRWRGDVEPQVLHLRERRSGAERVPHALWFRG